jgi:integrase
VAITSPEAVVVRHFDDRGSFMASYRKKFHSDGTTVWHVQVRKRGIPPLTQTFARITDARAWVAEQEFLLRKGDCLPIILSKRRLLCEAIDRFIAEDLVKPERQKQRRDLLSHLLFWRKKLGRYTLSSLTPQVLNVAIDKLGRETTVRGTLRSAATVHHIFSALSIVLKTAVGWQWLNKSPAAKVKLPTVDNDRLRYLDEDERQRLLSACRGSSNPCLYPMVLLALSTGMRLSELKGLRWGDLALSSASATGTARLTRTKNKTSRAVPIAGPALALMRSMQAAASQRGHQLVFPSHRLSGTRPMDIRRPWEMAVAAAKIKDFRFHDLRHSAASYLAMNGATTLEIAEVLGHKSLAMVKRYAHLSEPHTAGVVARMNAEVFGERSTQ